MIFGILERYIGKTIFKAIIITLFILVSLSSIIKFIDQLRKIGQGDYTILGAVVFTLLSIPKDIEILFPMAALLGAMFSLGQLAMRSELIVMQAAGYTRMDIACSVIKTAIPLVLLTIGISECIAPKGNKMAHDLRVQQMYGSSFVSTKQSGLWAKDGNDFIYIARLVSEKELSGINIYHFNDKLRLETVLHAVNAIFKDGIWTLSQVKTADLTNEQQVRRTQTSISKWNTNLTPEKLGVVVLDPASLSIQGLHNSLKYMQQSSKEAKRYQLNMWNKIFSPFSVAVMMLMGLAFIFGPLRSSSMGIRVITGISCGFLFYVLEKVFSQLTIVYNILPVLGALIPSVTFLLISMYILLKGK